MHSSNLRHWHRYVALKGHWSALLNTQIVWHIIEKHQKGHISEDPHNLVPRRILFKQASGASALPVRVHRYPGSLIRSCEVLHWDCAIEKYRCCGIRTGHDCKHDSVQFHKALPTSTMAAQLFQAPRRMDETAESYPWDDSAELERSFTARNNSGTHIQPPKRFLNSASGLLHASWLLSSWSLTAAACFTQVLA